MLQLGGADLQCKKYGRGNASQRLYVIHHIYETTLAGFLKRFLREHSVVLDASPRAHQLPIKGGKDDCSFCHSFTTDLKNHNQAIKQCLPANCEASKKIIITGG